MTLKAEVIDALVAAGCTAEQVAAAVKADIAEDERRLADKRAKDRDRQRRHRASRNVTVTPRDKRANGVTPRDKEGGSPQTPLPEENTPLPPSGASPRTACRLPEDWTLPDPWRDWALQEGWPAKRVMLEAEQFRDYWCAASGPNARKRDWQATWRNWIRKQPKTEDNGHGRHRSDAPTDADLRRDMFEGYEQADGLGTGVRPAGRS